MDVMVPTQSLITNVTAALNAVVTISAPNDFFTGQWVRVVVPVEYGMEVDYEQTKITRLSDTTYQTSLDLSAQPTFVTPSNPPPFTPAQLIPISGTFENAGRPLVG